jgi:transcriptional regulator with XRE-family HTH domain
MSSLPSLPTYQGDLAIFVSSLREQLFSSQEEVAAYFHLDRSRISRYENSLTTDTPKIGYLAGLVQLLAKQRGNNPEMQQALFQEVNKVVSHHYRHRRFKDWHTLSHAADEYLARQHAKKTARSSTSQLQAGDAWLVKLDQKLDLPFPTQLIGVEGHLKRLSGVLSSQTGSWLVCIDGLGGLGKTSLANALIRQPWLPGRFRDIAWVSAQRKVFLPGSGIKEISGPALHIDTLTNLLLEQLGSGILLSQSPEQKKAALTEILKSAPYLVVIDNLETLEDYEALLPTLLKLVNPSKFLLTSRHSLRTHPSVFSLGLKELSQADSFRLIRQEAEERGITEVSAASDAQLTRIHEVVGGNPLALKMVIGQMSILSLPQALENLKCARGKTIDDLYTYIYWQAWHMLDLASQQVFLMMPLAQNGTADQIVALTNLDPDQLNQALQRLAKLSLIQIGGSLEERHYTIHRLTETFILNEAIEWKTSI